MDPTRLVEQTKELFVINNENNKYVNLPSLVSATNHPCTIIKPLNYSFITDHYNKSSPS
jgi:hypothetical protein